MPRMIPLGKGVYLYSKYKRLNYTNTYKIHMTAKKVTMTFQPSVLRKLDRIRGETPRSTFLSWLVQEEWGKK